MSVIDDVTRELLDKTEFLAMVTEGPDGPHVVGNWGEYLRRLGLEGDRIVLPAGYYRRTEENLARNDRIQIMVASRSVQGRHGPGQGCVLKGRAGIVTEGELAERAKAAFPWARGALVITISSVETQL
jgi:hypothetical protein